MSILWRLGNTSVKIKRSKCQLYHQRVAFLGHVVSGQGIATNLDKIQVVRDWPPHMSGRVMELPLILLLLQEFCSQICHGVPPHYAVDGEGVRGGGGADIHVVRGVVPGHFQASQGSTLYHPGSSLPRSSSTNDLGHGCVRHWGGHSAQSEGCRRQGKGAGQPGPNEARDELLHDEEGAPGNDLWWPEVPAYLAGTQFTIQIDHSALLDAKEPKGQMAWWIQKLGRYKFQVKHCPGSEMAWEHGWVVEAALQTVRLVEWETQEEPTDFVATMSWDCNGPPMESLKG